METTTACRNCTFGIHAGCTARDGDCTNICHPGYDPEAYTEQLSEREFAVYVNGTGRTVVTGTREQAEAEARRIARDAEWVRSH